MKPPPIRSLERRLRGGWAVVMDDVFAGIYTMIVLRLALASFELM
jgi:phosphatidylglycerophosphatase A